MLANLQNMVQNLVDTSNTRYEAMMNNFQEFYNVITSNRAELAPQTGTDMSAKEPEEE